MAKCGTADPHILAIGDIAGEPMLAHKATHEGRVAAEVVAGQASGLRSAGHSRGRLHRSRNRLVRLTEEQAKKEGRKHEVAIYPWAASGRAIALGRTEGLTKVLVDPETERVLGVGIVGAGAGELIAEAALAIEMGCEVTDHRRNHPPPPHAQ